MTDASQLPSAVAFDVSGVVAVVTGAGSGN